MVLPWRVAVSGVARSQYMLEGEKDADVPIFIFTNENVVMRGKTDAENDLEEAKWGRAIRLAQLGTG